MDLTLSKTGDYAVRISIALATTPDRSLTIAQVSDLMGLPAAFTPHVARLLIDAGIVDSRAGRGGGYRLARDPGSISVLEVVEAVEGSLRSTRCPIRGGPCSDEGFCALHPTWVRTSDAVRRVLASTTLEDVASQGALPALA